MGHKKEAIDVIMDMKRSRKYLKYDTEQLALGLLSAIVVKMDKKELTVWDSSEREWMPNRVWIPENVEREKFEFPYEVFKDTGRKRKLAHRFDVLKCLVEGLWRMGHNKGAIDVIMDMKRSRKYLKYDINQLALGLASAKVVEIDKKDLTVWDSSEREWRPNRIW